MREAMYSASHDPETTTWKKLRKVGEKPSCSRNAGLGKQIRRDPGHPDPKRTQGTYSARLLIAANILATETGLRFLMSGSYNTFERYCIFVIVLVHPAYKTKYIRISQQTDSLVKMKGDGVMHVHLPYGACHEN